MPEFQDRTNIHRRLAAAEPLNWIIELQSQPTIRADLLPENRTTRLGQAKMFALDTAGIRPKERTPGLPATPNLP